MSEKDKNVCSGLNYFEHFLVFVSAFSRCVSISAFASLVGVAVCLASSALGLKISRQGLKSISESSRKRKKS